MIEYGDIVILALMKKAVENDCEIENITRRYQALQNDLGLEHKDMCELSNMADKKLKSFVW